MKKILPHYSKTSWIVRIVLTLILAAMIACVIALRVPISKAVYHWESDSVTNAEFSVHFIDVGQGDAALIELNDGKNMLIDCGPRSSADGLVKYLKEEQIERIDYFLLTHPDADHVGGGVKIFQNFKVGDFYRPMYRCKSEAEPSEYPCYETQVYNDVITAYHTQVDCNMHYSSTSLSSIEGEGYSITFIHPSKAMSDRNESSAVVKAELGGKSFLFMGDAPVAAEKEILSSGASVKADVLKVGHHGSNTSSSENFLDAVKPSYAVISCGANNSYGHPSQEVMQRLQERGITCLNTSSIGNIRIKVKDGTLYAGVDGKMIDYVLISVILGVIILAVWGVPEFKKGKVSKKR